MNIILKLTKLNHGIPYKNFFIFFSILILSILLFSSTSHAATFNSNEIYVNGSSGSDSNNGFSWSTAKLTIKNAIGTVANNGTVNIANGVYSGTGNTNININKNITIKGQSQYSTIIDGQNTSQILHINNGCNVIITNLTLGRGYVQQLDGGGAIYNEGNLIVYDSRFMYNTANPYSDAYAITKIPKCGGAIYNSGLLGLERCTFLNNTAAHYNYNVIYYSVGNGGAIVNNGTLVIDSSIFINNTAAEHGGAILNSGASNVYNSIFQSNSAGYGGAIAGATDTDNSLTLIGSYFLNNTAFPVGSESTTAEGRGGAIYGICTVENCGFMNNTATKGGAINGLGNCSINSSYFLNNIAINNNTKSVALVYGGAVYNSGGTLSVNNTNFANNLATGTSSIWCYGGAVCTSDHLIINNCTFTNNSVTGKTNEGGAISIITNGNCSVNNSTFTNNTACYGGAISNDGIINNVNNSSFINNSANNGGAINNNGVFYGINNTTFLNNTATNNGGAIRNVKVLGNITHSNFTGNNAAYNGGAIYQYTYTLTINDGNFTGNKASNGGACYNDIGEVGINKCNYTNNDADNSGGAIYNYHGGCHVSNCTLNGNTANQYGGAIYNDNDLSVLTVYGSNLINNAASIGSAIYTMSNGTQIEFNRISGNSGNYDIHTALGIDASNNWWGTNFDGTDPITAGRINDDIINIVSPWIVLMVTASPTTIGSNGNSTIIADLSHDSRVLSDPTHPQLYYHSSGGHLPDGIPISFSTTLGIITSGSSGSLTNEKAQMILNSGNIKGTADVSATIDDETVHSNVIINTGSIITPGAQLNDAVDNTALSWTTGGNSPWFSETDTTNYGGDAAQSGDINDSQSNWIQTTVTGPGTLSFYWKVSSESGYDFLKFFVDGTQIYNITGDVDWQQKTYTLTSGTHTLKWEYIKDGSVSNGLDCSWLDNVQLTTANTAPTITGSNPANFATNIPKDKTITITFSETIKAGDLSKITLQSSTGTAIPITKSISGNTLTITHPTLLTSGTFYKIFLNTDCIRDLAGNPLQTKVLGFTTSTDNTAPTVTGSNPANFATNIPKDKTITITFNEAIKANNLNNIVLQSSTGTTIPITKSISGNTLTITHPLLAPGTFYKIFLNTDCIRDLAGNPLQTKVLGFTTIDDIAPTVTGSNPANFATNIPKDKTITVTFSEAIKAGDLSKITLQSSTGTTIPITTSINGNTLAITHPLLASGTFYKIFLNTGCITDLAGNALQSKVLGFTTSTDNTAPTITGSNPTNFATSVSKDKTITITFNEAIKAGDLSKITLQSSTGTTIPITKSISGNTLTITHPTLLTSGTFYKIFLNTDCIRDLAGNPLQLKVLGFTTSM